MLPMGKGAGQYHSPSLHAVLVKCSGVAAKAARDLDLADKPFALWVVPATLSQTAMLAWETYRQKGYLGGTVVVLLWAGAGAAEKVETAWQVIAAAAAAVEEAGMVVLVVAFSSWSS